MDSSTSENQKSAQSWKNVKLPFLRAGFFELSLTAKDILWCMQRADICKTYLKSQQNMKHVIHCKPLRSQCIGRARVCKKRVHSIQIFSLFLFLSNRINRFPPAICFSLFVGGQTKVSLLLRYLGYLGVFRNLGIREFS